MGYLLQQSSTSRPLLFLMVDSTDHITGKTGLTPTVTISKNGAAFAAPAGAVTELANGWYKVAGNATDTATTGPLLLHATGTGADPNDDAFEVVAFNPDDGVRLGLTAIPNVASGSAGGLIIQGTGTTGLNVSSGKAPVVQLTAADFAAASLNGKGDWLLSSGYTAPPSAATIAAATEAAILNEGDATALLAAIAAKVETFLINEGDATATLAAIGAAVWANGSRTLTSDPWATSLPGAYAAGTAGKILSGIPVTLGTPVDLNGGGDTLAGMAVDINDLVSVIPVTTWNVDLTSYTVPNTASKIVQDIAAKTTNLPASPAAVGDIPTASANADALLARNAAGGAGAGKTVAYYLQGGPPKVAFDVPAVGQYTVYGSDGTTVLGTGTYTTAAGDPVVSLDPA